jgi:hypothetical protein
MITPPTLLISALVLSLAVISQPDPASAAGCRNAGGSSKNFHYSSQVSGSVFTLCGKLVITEVKKKVVVTPDPPKVRPSTDPKPKAKPTLRPKPPKASKPPTVVKPPKKKVVVKRNTRKNDGLGFFRPDAPLARLSPVRILRLGEQVNFSVNSKVHFRSNRLLGNRGLVRFSPASFQWSFSNGVSATGRSVQQSFDRAGEYSAVVSVRFRVAYRFGRSGAWIRDPGVITLPSNILRFGVDQALQEAGDIRLVNQNCLTPIIEASNISGCRG